MYIFGIYVMVSSEEDPSFESELENLLEKHLRHTNKAEIVSTISKSLCGDNYGRCIKCGAWTTDYSKSNPIKELSNGAKEGDNWYCDLCLPSNHPNAF